MSKKTLESKPAESPKMREITLADLDVIPPAKRPRKPGAPMPLPEVEDHLRGFDAKIDDRTLGYHNEVIYDIAGAGLMLLKAQAHYALSSQGETVSLKRRKRAKGGQLTATEDGFFGWIRRAYCAGVFESEAEAERFFQAKKRTAYNYMKLATNAGLTSDHSVDDIEFLRQRQALHGRRPSELYKGKLALEEGDIEPDDSGPPANLVAETFNTTRLALGELRAAKEEMAPDEYESACAMLREELEAFTGRAWEITDREPGIDATEHGEVVTAKSAKAAKKLLTPEARAKIAAAMREKWAKKATAKKGARK